jgi:hypothetical protein
VHFSMKSLSCCYPFIISYCILYHTYIQIVYCLPSSFCIVLRLNKIAENVVFKDLLNYPFSVFLLHNTLGIVNKGRSTVPLPNLITCHKTKTESIEDIFASLIKKRLTSWQGVKQQT